MKKVNGNDMTVGSIRRQILNFAIPMAVGLFLSMGYGIINTIWVGNLLGKEAVAAVAASFPIIFILISVASGSTTATAILVSQNYGSRNLKMIERVISNSFMLFISMGVFLTTAALVFRNKLLNIMGTPADILNMASEYLLILLLGFFITFIYYVVNAFLSGIGDTKTPAIFLAMSTVVNAILDPLFISLFGLNGAGFASLISGISALAGALVYVNRRKFIVSLSFRGIRPDFEIIRQLVKLGIPSLVQQCLMPVSLMFITSFINRFGTDAIAAYGAGSKVDYLAIIPAMALGNAASIITGQNIGAGKPDRVKELFKWGIIMNVSFLLMVTLIVSSFPRQILSVFVHDSNVLGIGEGYIRCNALGYCIFGFAYVTNGIITGGGKTLITMTISIISLILVRVPLAGFMSGTGLGIKGIWYSIVLTYLVTATLSMAFYLSGKWNKIRRPVSEEDSSRAV